MNDLGLILIALIGGLGLGFAFFGSLHWSTKRIARFQHPALTMLPLFFIRIATAVFCFVWLIHVAPLKYVGIFFAGFLLTQIWFISKKIKTRRGES